MALLISNLVFAAGVAFFLWHGKRIDWWKSSFQPLHLTPPAEKNKLTRGADGYFSQTKSYIVNFGGIGVCAAANLALIYFADVQWGGIGFGILFAIIALVIRLVIKKDIAAMEQAKEDQLEYLAKIKASPRAVESITPLSLKSESFKGQDYFFYRNFADIRHNVPSGEVDMTPVVDDMRAKFLKLATEKPESEWWTLSRSKDL